VEDRGGIRDGRMGTREDERRHERTVEDTGGIREVGWGQERTKEDSGGQRRPEGGLFLMAPFFPVVVARGATFLPAHQSQ
jgi:hypothetical protein